MVIAEQGIWGVVIGPLVAEVTLLVVQLAVTLSTFRAAAHWATWKRMASYGLPFVPHHLQAVGLDLFGLYMVREMLGLGAAGLYGTASRFASPAAFIVNSVQASWVPYKFQIHAEDSNSKAFFQSTFTYYVAALSYLWVGVSLWGPEVLRLMTAPSYHAAAGLLWATALIPVCQGIYFMSGTGIELSDNTRPLPLVSFAGLCTVVALALLLVPQIQAYGAALATSSGWIVMAVAIYFLSQRRFALAYDWPTIGCFVLLAVSCVLVGYAIQPFAIWARLSINLGISLAYPLVGLALLMRSSTERERVRILYLKFRGRGLTPST